MPHYFHSPVVCQPAVNTDEAVIKAQLDALEATLDGRLDLLEAGTFKITIGTGIVGAITVTHNLGTLDITDCTIRLADGQTVYPIVSRTNVNQVTVDFGATVPILNGYRLILSRS